MPSGPPTEKPPKTSDRTVTVWYDGVMTNSEQALTQTETETTTNPLAEAYAAMDRHTRRGLGQAAIFPGATPDLQGATAAVQVRADSPAAIDGALADGVAPPPSTPPAP